MHTNWKILPEAPNDFLPNSKFPQIISNLLYHRKIRTTEEAKEFLEPNYTHNVHNPFLFKDMEKAVQKIFKSIKNKEKIVIHGDYDADGISSAIILDSVLAKLGADVDVFLPHREKDGYGLNLNTVQMFKQSNIDIIITCDCGISNKKEIEKANEYGISVIITDHHTIPAEIPPAYAIIHPKIKEEPYPDKNLAGAGVAFKLLQALLLEHRKENSALPNGESHESFEKWSLDMVAIATIADMVPLRGESRTFTKYGLKVLNITRRTGLKKLFSEARLLDDDGVLRKKIDSDVVGFYIAPRLNAAGRIAHPKIAFDLVKTESGTEATDLAYAINEHNQNRKKETEKILQEAMEKVEREQMNKEVLCVVGKEWASGLVGLVASRLKEKYYKPALVMAHNSTLVGSGRSVDGFNLIETMQKMPEFFVKFGGHPMACGFTLKGLEVVPYFQETLIEHFLNSDAKDKTKTILIDSEVKMEQVDWEIYNYTQKFEPFGKENDKPKFLAKGLTILKIQPIGKDGKHLRLMVMHQTRRIFKMVGWSLCNGKGVNWCQNLKNGDKIDVVFEISINDWNGNRELQRTIIDIKKTTK
jgi:single-stranded-DNA-specific exonuclease